MAKYGISKKAVEDLDSIWNYTAQTWSEEQAVKYYNDIRNAIIILANLPDYLGTLSSTPNGKTVPCGYIVFCMSGWISCAISDYSFFNASAGFVRAVRMLW